MSRNKCSSRVLLFITICDLCAGSPPPRAVGEEETRRHQRESNRGRQPVVNVEAEEHVCIQSSR
jgi:hypothetical protein